MSNRHDATGKNYRARKSEEKDNKNKDDYFPTYHGLTRILLDEYKFSKGDCFLEPCAGAGDITKIIKEYYPDDTVLEIDINPRREGIINADFLDEKDDRYCYYTLHNIITNPPFNLADKFFIRATEIATKNIFFILPLDYLHGIGRFKMVYESGCNGFKLKTCYPFVRRPFFNAKWRPDGPIPTGAQSFAWFHFAKRVQGHPTIQWMHNEDMMGTPIDAAQIMIQDFSEITIPTKGDLLRLIK